MTLEQLKNQYLKVPLELKNTPRWVCWTKEERDGKTIKMPINPLSGKRASVSDPNTWAEFELALNGCVKFNCIGLGFVFNGSGDFFGVDLDNHGELTKEEFRPIALDFINTLDSYAELSQSGQGVHIICKGNIPKGKNRKGNVEMYDNGRFLAFTGRVVHNQPIKDCEEAIKPLWEKYLFEEENKNLFNSENKYNFYNFDTTKLSQSSSSTELSDEQVLNKAFSSKNGNEFSSLYNGDMSRYNDDHSSADLALCSHLAFWTNSNPLQIDRIFRKSALMRQKWDEMRGVETYGARTIAMAISKMTNGYSSPKNNDTYVPTPTQTPTIIDTISEIEGYSPIRTIDDNGEPIFNIKRNFKSYPLNDTGNAERFYDYFGDRFRYNKTDKIFMHWNGVKWEYDEKDISRKYANKFIELLKEDRKKLDGDFKEALANGDEKEIKNMQKLQEAVEKNITRVSNKAGKDAMLEEFKSLFDIPIVNNELDVDKFTLNTENGLLNLNEKKLHPFDYKNKISKSTHIPISFETPKTWIKFLHDIFKRNSPSETEELINCIQKCLGYTLTGSTREQVMFILWGDGSNGKSTFSDTIQKIMGDYGTTVASDVILSKKTTTDNNTLGTLARLKGVRYVQLEEIDEDSKLAEGLVKRITGSTQITARQPFGKEFTYMPEFKIWLSVNDKPIIKGRNYGIWRRIFMFPFTHIFREEEKDKDMPIKLEKELPQILGWIYQGYEKYVEDGGIDMPNCIRVEIDAYKQEMDTITQFISRNCVNVDKYLTPTKMFYANFKKWSFDNGDPYCMKSGKFEEEMRKKGYKVIIDKGEPCFIGIKLNSDKNGNVYVFNNYDEDDI